MIHRAQYYNAIIEWDGNQFIVIAPIYLSEKERNAYIAWALYLDK